MRLLLVRAGGGMRKAIPLDLVARLEEIAVDDIRRSDGRMLVPYRDRLMPLVLAAEDVDLPPGTRKPVLVFAESDPGGGGSSDKRRLRQMGLVVDAIDDIIESQVNVEIRAGRPDIIGSALVGGEPTEVVDTAHHLTRASGDWFRHPEQEVASRRVLLVDDSGFFRNLIVSLLRAAGIDALTAANGEEALALLHSGPPVNLVITDIDMPVVDGYELTRRLRADPQTARLPVIAMSGHTGPRHMELGAQAGFTRHLPKLDRDQLMEAVTELLGAEEPVS
jgi:two-component system chemotaxis sensor kinase CheA